MNDGVECKDVREVIEAIAAGDVQPDAPTRAHLESCIGCASALATAVRIETALAARPAAPAPPRFPQAVVQRIRRERWSSEQRVDRLFNFAIVAAVVLVAGGLAAALNVDMLLGVAGSIWLLIRGAGGEMLQGAIPAVNTYVTAAALLLSALGMWWWVEQRLQF